MRKSNDRNSSGRNKGRSSAGNRKDFGSKRSSGGFKKDRDDDKGSGRKSFSKSGGYKKDEGSSRKRYSDDDKSDRKRSFKKDDDYGRKKFGDDKRGGYKKKYDDGGDDRKRSFKKDDDYGRKKFGDDKRGGYKKKYDDGGDDRKRSFKKDDDYGRKKFGDDKRGGYKKKYDDGGDDRKRSFKKDDDYGRKKFGDDKRGGYKKKYDDGDDRKPRFRRDDDSAEKKEYGDRKSAGSRKKSDDGDDRKKSFKRDSFSRKSGFKRNEESDEDARKDDFKYDRFGGSNKKFTKEEYQDDDIIDVDAREQRSKDFKKKKRDYEKKQLRPARENKNDDGLIRLNKFIANTGVCSRREADELIKAGAVKVNGKVVTELGTKINPDDKVQYGDQTIKTEKLVYILLNKPKDYITTMDDPQGRKTVMSLIRGACKERVYPVGRLDRNTTGLLLFTNDGELTKRLTHPKFLVSKMYHAQLDKNMRQEDFDKMKNGLELEDGFIKPDRMEYVADGSDKKQIGLEIHSGRNRIVRRMFEHLGYDVVKLDRVTYAGITKKELPRGKWRFLEPKEVGFLKML